MIKEFNNESQARALADSLGLFMTKCRGIYIVGSNKDEICEKYNMGYWGDDDVFYDKEIFVGSRYLKIKDKDIVDASTIELPYRVIHCSRMFRDCEALEIPPIIPDGVRECTAMFDGCKSLRIPPNIPVSVKNCNSMFAWCESLATPSQLPDGIIECRFMFQLCSSLKVPPIIPDSVKDCRGMLRECWSLETPPQIPESVKDCTYMFHCCRNLKQKPQFPPNATIEDALTGTPFDNSTLNAF